MHDQVHEGPITTGTGTSASDARRCPRCASPDFVRSHRKGMWKDLMAGFHKYPYRCRSCQALFYRSADWTRKDEIPLETAGNNVSSADPLQHIGSEKRPSNISMKLVLAVLLIAVAGFGIYYFAKSRQTGSESTILTQFVLEQNFNRPGDDYSNFPLKEPKIELCAEQCLRETSCRVFTFVKPTAPGTAAYCWLKGSAQPPKPDNCCVTGLKTRMD